MVMCESPQELESYITERECTSGRALFVHAGVEERGAPLCEHTELLAMLESWKK